MDDLAEKWFSTHGELEEIVVFGSFETNNFAPGSDLDVFLSLSESSQPVRERLIDFLPETFPVPLDLFPFTREEMRELTPSPILAAVGRSRWRYRRAGIGA
jgi:predicted nucleotidyltransferase